MRWKIEKRTRSDLVSHLLNLREIKDKNKFFNPPRPSSLTTKDIGLEAKQLHRGLDRIRRAVQKKERVVVYGDYDADGVTGTAILWEALNRLGADVWPYLPDRKTEGYGFSAAGIERVLNKHAPNLIISVDHGITGGNQIARLTQEGVDVIVTDHHQPPTKQEMSALVKQTQAVVHTTTLSGAGIAWYMASVLNQKEEKEHLGLAAFGTIADIVPLVGPNRQIAWHGLQVLTETGRAGLRELKKEAGIMDVAMKPYHIGYVLAPRINAAGRLEHALDALRLLCTNDEAAARGLAHKLGRINRQRQKLLAQQLNFSLENLKQAKTLPPLFILADKMYEEGIIGLIAGKLAEKYWRPTIVVAQGENGVSKASARSIPGVDIIALIRHVEDLLLSAGGHPMAAGFAVETATLPTVAEELLRVAEDRIEKEQLTRFLQIDAEIGLNEATPELHDILRKFTPHGAGNPRPLFCTRSVYPENIRTVGDDGKHLKFTVEGKEAIAFGRGYLVDKLVSHEPIDIAYHFGLNNWNGREILQFKVRDIKQT